MPASTDGQWVGLSKTPGDSRVTGDNNGVFVIHAVLLKNGNVLWWSGHAESVHYLAESYEWDPTTPLTTAIRAPFPAGVDVFCCHHALLEDGRVMTAGGAAATHGRGIKSICIYDPGSHTWSRIGDMNQARWYPTLVELFDGNLLVFSGRTDNSSLEIAESYRYEPMDIFRHVPFLKPVVYGNNRLWFRLYLYAFLIDCIRLKTLIKTGHYLSNPF
jgi:hypothetical protein